VGRSVFLNASQLVSVQTMWSRLAVLTADSQYGACLLECAETLLWGTSSDVVVAADAGDPLHHTVGALLGVGDVVGNN
jgi:hypothetical protein